MDNSRCSLVCVGEAVESLTPVAQCTQSVFDWVMPGAAEAPTQLGVVGAASEPMPLVGDVAADEQQASSQLHGGPVLESQHEPLCKRRRRHSFADAIAKAEQNRIPNPAEEMVRKLRSAQTIAELDALMWPDDVFSGMNSADDLRDFIHRSLDAIAESTKNHREVSVDPQFFNEQNHARPFSRRIACVMLSRGLAS